MFAQPFALGVCLLTIIVLQCNSVNGQGDECHNVCPGSTNPALWASSLVLAAENGTSARLRWDPFQTMTDPEYLLQYRPRDTGGGFMNSSITNGTNVTLTGLDPNAIYEGRVCLVTDPSNCGNCFLCFDTGDSPEPPTAPLSLTGSAENALTVQLMWMAPARGTVTSYIITFVPQSGTSMVRNETSTRLTRAVGSLFPNTTYQFGVRAANEFGVSPFSNFITVTTETQSGSPGYLLASDANALYYYYTLSANLEASISTNEPVHAIQLLPMQGITGISYYPTSASNGEIYVSSDNQSITRLTVVLNKAVELANITVTDSGVLLTRTSNVSLITVDWVNDMLYWLESNDTHMVIMHSLLNGSEINCVTSPISSAGISITSIEVDPIHGYLYWSIKGSGGGMFRLDLSVARLGDCLISNMAAINLLSNNASVGVSSMSLNLEDSLMYHVISDINLYSISLEEDEIVLYGSDNLLGRSLSSYNEFLAVPTGFPLVIFARIRSQQSGTLQVVFLQSFSEPVNHLHMIRDEFQPQPVPPGPVGNVKYYATSSSVNFTWSPPQYIGSVFGPSSFNNWIYSLTFEQRDVDNSSTATTTVDYRHYSDLVPNTIYLITIFPNRAVTTVNNVDQLLISRWVVQTIEEVFATLILATDGGIYTALLSDSQAARVAVDDNLDQGSIGVAYDFYRNIIYWASEGAFANLQQITVGNTTFSTLRNQIRSPRSMAVDYIGQRLYWIEASNTITYIFLASGGSDVLSLVNDTGITNLVVDSPRGLLFWTHNGDTTRGISFLRLNGLGGRISCVVDDSTPYYHAITLDTENRRIFWIKDIEGSFQLGVAVYGDDSCDDVVNKMINPDMSVESLLASSGRISMAYAAGSLLLTSSTLPKAIYTAPSNFSSAPAAFQPAIGCYNISTSSGNGEIRSVIANQTSQQFLPGDVLLDSNVNSSIPTNIRLDNTSTPTSINITWDAPERINPALITYQVTYSLSRRNRSTESDVIMTSNNYFVLVDQSPETTLNVSVRAYTRWYSSDMTPSMIITSNSQLPSQIEQTGVSVFRREIGSSDLSVLITWTGLNIEQAGGVLSSYDITLYTIDQTTNGRTSLGVISILPSVTLLELNNLTANRMYLFTVRAVNSAGSGNESEEVMFNTNGPQPPMELIVIGSGGLSRVGSDGMSMEVDSFGRPFAIDSRESIVYYIDAGNRLMTIKLNVPNSASLLFALPSTYDSLTLDWVGRQLYLVQLQGSNLIIVSLSLDNPAGLTEVYRKTNVLSGVSSVEVTLSPYLGLLYWIEADPSVISLNQLNLTGGSVTALFQANSRKRNAVCSGVDSIGQLTAALTYDVITDRLWVATVAGDIWSCDLSGCNCTTEVDGTMLVQPPGTLSDVGLPASSVSLDSVNIFWSGSAGVFSVPRDGVAVAMPLATTDSSLVVSIDPGQQPLPVEMCLYPALTPEAQPLMPGCTATSSNSLNLTWTGPPVTAECQNQLFVFPTLKYNVTYQVNDLTEQQDVSDTFSNEIILTDLFSFTNYTISVVAFNVYTPTTSPGLATVMCNTTEGGPSPVTSLRASPSSTVSILVEWSRPISSGSAEGTVSYNISLDGVFLDLLNDNVMSYTIVDLMPGVSYDIEVITNNSLGAGDPVQITSATYPNPPNPVVNNEDIGNISVLVRLNLSPAFIPLDLSLALRQTGGEEMLIAIPDDTPASSSATVMLSSLMPVTRYSLRVVAVYPNNERIYSSGIDFTTLASVPGVPSILIVRGTLLQWEKPSENGQPISAFTIRLQTMDSQSVDRDFGIFNDSVVEFSFDLSAPGVVQRGVQTNVSVNAINEIGSSNFSEVETFTIAESGGNSEAFSTGVLIGIIAGASVVALIILITIIVLCYCYRVRPKNYDYAFRVEVPYDMELRKLRLNQMRMANNDLYSPNYNPDDVETLKKFPRDRIKLEKLLGRGAFGEVWAGTAMDIMGSGSGPHPVALKTLQKSATEADQQSFLSEAIVMSNFDHPNVLPVLGVCLNNNPFFLILELMEAGDLLAFLRGARQEHGPPLLTLDELVKVAHDIANGARYLETQHFVHRDLAARNCLVSSKGPDRVVKIGDFGLARDVYHSDYYRKEGQGLLPVRWMAPESLLDGKFTVDSDIWSYGILLWETTTLGRQPYPARSNQEVFQFVIGGGRCDKPDNCHPKLYRMMRQCWAHRPEERPRFTVLVDTLTRLHERLVEGTEFSSDDSEMEDEEEPRYTTQLRGSGGRRSLRSSIRSGASNIVTGIVNLTRAGSMRMRNSVRRQGSIRRQDEVNEARGTSTPTSRGRSISSSEQQLLDQSSGSDHMVETAGAEELPHNDTKEQNGFREIGPF